MNLPIAILDTSVYIHLWRSSRFLDNMIFAKNRFLIRQCSVVLHELRRGAIHKQAVRFVENLMRNSPEILNPTDTDWWQAAQILQDFSNAKHRGKGPLQRLQNDCLIALCARRVGGVVITTDTHDFGLLEKNLPCKVLFW